MSNVVKIEETIISKDIPSKSQIRKLFEGNPKCAGRSLVECSIRTDTAFASTNANDDSDDLYTVIGYFE